MLGGMLGDIIGAPVEGMTAHDIKQRHGALHDVVPGEHMGLLRGGGTRVGMYTDDTNCVLALGESLRRCGGLDAEDCALAYAESWLAEPQRGYPDSAMLPMVGTLEGLPPWLTARLCFDEGSFANGGAMRIAPVGLTFRHASLPELRAAVSQALLSTHVHPEAVDAAIVFARAIGLLLVSPTAKDASPVGRGFAAAPFLDELSRVAATPAMRRKLELLRRHAGGAQWGSVVWTLDHDGGGSGPTLWCPHPEQKRWFQVRATSAVACALWAFVDAATTTARDAAGASCSGHMSGAVEAAVIGAVRLGGDTDTIGALAGALAGALCGSGGLPQRWCERAENGARGRDYAAALGKSLATLDLRTPLRVAHDHAESSRGSALAGLPTTAAGACSDEDAEGSDGDDDDEEGDEDPEIGVPRLSPELQLELTESRVRIQAAVSKAGGFAEYRAQQQEGRRLLWG